MNYYKPLFSFLMRKVSKKDGLVKDLYVSEIELDICGTKLKNLISEKKWLEGEIEELKEKLKIIDNLSFSMEEYFSSLRSEEKSKFILKILKIKNSENIKHVRISINYGEIQTDVAYID